jgi:hypothetical protein
MCKETNKGSIDLRNRQACIEHAKKLLRGQWRNPDGDPKLELRLHDMAELAYSLLNAGYPWENALEMAVQAEVIFD